MGFIFTEEHFFNQSLQKSQASLCLYGLRDGCVLSVFVGVRQREEE